MICHIRAHGLAFTSFAPQNDSLSQQFVVEKPKQNSCRKERVASSLDDSEGERQSLPKAWQGVQVYITIWSSWKNTGARWRSGWCASVWRHIVMEWDVAKVNAGVFFATF